MSINLTSLCTLLLLLSLQACQPDKTNKPESDLASSNIPDSVRAAVNRSKAIQTAANDTINLVSACNVMMDFDFMKTLDNQEGIVEEYVITTHGPTTRRWFRVKYEDVPTHYMTPCNLPDEFKQIGLRLRFSGVVYQPKNMSLVQISSVPVVLTQVQKAESGN